MRQKTPSLPKSVKIGAFTYSINAWKGKEGASKEMYGEISHVLREINIDAEFGYRQAAASLLHEILHGIMVNWNIEPRVGEERLVTTINLALSAVWRDNPSVMAWIHKGLS